MAYCSRWCFISPYLEEVGEVTVFGNTNMTVTAPVGRGLRIGCSGLSRVLRRRVTNNASTVVVYKAANRSTAVARRRRTTAVHFTVRHIGRHVPIVTKANSGYAEATVRLSGRTRRSKTSKLLLMAPCCGGTARGKLVTRCATVYGRMGVPTVLCGMPDHAKYKLRPRAITALIGSIRGVINVGRTSKGVDAITRVVRLYSNGMSLCSKGSSRIMPLLTLNKVNIVSILSGMTPACMRSVYCGFFSKSVTNDHGVRLSTLPLVSTLFYRMGPVPIGTTLGVVKGRIKALETPLARVRSTRGRILGGTVVSLKVLWRGFFGLWGAVLLLGGGAVN